MKHKPRPKIDPLAQSVNPVKYIDTRSGKPITHVLVDGKWEFQERSDYKVDADGYLLGGILQLRKN